MSPNAISLRTGAEYLRSLRDGRRVFVDGGLYWTSLNIGPLPRAADPREALRYRRGA